MKTSRNTTAKTTILEIIKHSDVALSHTEIQTLSNNICDRVTIYRVLDRLVGEDVIHKIVNLDGTIKYASCHHAHNEVEHTHNHIHFSCEKCHAVTCLDTVEPTFKMPSNYLVKAVNFTLSGLCPSCM
jgi:Fur family ferric uptake transcriptional regulator